MQKRESPEFRSPEVGISAIDKAPLSRYNVKIINNSIIPIEFPGRRHGSGADGGFCDRGGLEI